MSLKKLNETEQAIYDDGTTRYWARRFIDKISPTGWGLDWILPQVKNLPLFLKIVRTEGGTKAEVWEVEMWIASHTGDKNSGE